jgi:magnesium-transporting ATPase (P-type)
MRYTVLLWRSELINCEIQTNDAQRKAFNDINKLTNEFLVHVIRGGEEMQILSTDVVVGDVL